MAASHQGFNVFICHAGENKPFVRQLVDRLEKGGLKKDQIFYDEISLQPGDELDSIIKVIESPSLKLFVFVVSKYCFQSNKTWIRAEWEAALENNKQIFPIWLDDNNDGFKAFGNLVREFSYKLRKTIAQRVNPQEISTSLPGLSGQICSLIYGEDRTQSRLPPSTDAAVLSFRQNILPDVLPAKLKLEFVQRLYNQLVDKADALFDKDIFNNKKKFKKAQKRFASYKATVVSIIPKGCFIFNLRFFQPCNVDEFYHDHFRLGPDSLSAALTRLLVTDEMRAAAGGEELMVRVEVRYDDYIRVRRQLCMTGLLKATSMDNLSSLARPCTDERKDGRTSLEGLDLVITSTQDSSFAELVAHPVTRQLAYEVRRQTQQIATMEGRLEMAKHQAEIQEATVWSLHREVGYLSKKDEEAQKVLLTKTEEVHKLRESNRGLEARIEALLTVKTKVVIPSAHKDDAPRGAGGVPPEELDTPPKEAKGEAPEELDSSLRGAEGGKMGKKKNRDGPHKCGICSDGFFSERGVQDHRRDKHGSSGGGYYYAASSPVTIPANMNTFLDSCSPGDVHTYISQHLQTDESYRKECSDVVDHVATFFRGRQGFTLNRFIKGGSLGKGTAIKSKSDIDCVMFTSDLPSIDSDDYEDDLDTLLEWMEDQLESSRIPVEISGRTSYAVKLRVKTRKAGHASHDVDLLLAPDLLGEYTTPNGVYAMMGRLRSSERQYCSAALVELQRDFVKNQPAEVKDLIRLVKMWKASCVTESSLTSYPLELLCIHTWPSYGTVPAAFKAVLQKLSNYSSISAHWTVNYSYSRVEAMLGKRPLILDPANPYNNVADRCRNWSAVARAAQETLRKPFFSR